VVDVDVEAKRSCGDSHGRVGWCDRWNFRTVAQAQAAG
jgi:hypothetical protein